MKQSYHFFVEDFIQFIVIVFLLIRISFLQVLISKTKIEGEDALRKLVVALNGLAGIAIIKQEFPQAVSLYKEALYLVEEHSDDFRLDSLLNIHIHHNLAEALPLTENCLQQKSASVSSEKLLPGTCAFDKKDNHAMGREEEIKCNASQNINSQNPFNLPSRSARNGETSSDIQLDISAYVQCLRETCEDLKQKFLSIFTSRLSLAQQEFRRLYEQVFFLVSGYLKSHLFLLNRRLSVVYACTIFH